MHLDEGRTLKKIFSPGFTLDWISTPGTMFHLICRVTGASQVALMVKNTPANAGDSEGLSWIPGSGRSPGVGNGNPLRLVWEIPWTEESGGLQSMELKRFRHD